MHVLFALFQDSGATYIHITYDYFDNNYDMVMVVVAQKSRRRGPSPPCSSSLSLSSSSSTL